MEKDRIPNPKETETERQRQSQKRQITRFFSQLSFPIENILSSVVRMGSRSGFYYVVVGVGS